MFCIAKMTPDGIEKIFLFDVRQILNNILTLNIFWQNLVKLFIIKDLFTYRGSHHDI